MSKISLGLSVVALAALAVFAGLSSRAVVHAQSDDVAMVIHYCPTEVASHHLDGYHYEYCFDSVQTSGGPEHASFHGELIAPSTPPTITVRITTGWHCLFEDGRLSTEQELTITPSGNVEGECRVD